MAKKLKIRNVMALDNTTQKKIIEHYEFIRQSGVTNMFDYTTVKHVARKIGLTELYDFIKDDVDCYKSVLRNFSKLMKKFDVKQK